VVGLLVPLQLEHRAVQAAAGLMVATGAQEAQTAMQVVALPLHIQAAAAVEVELLGKMEQTPLAVQVVTAEKRQVPIQ
jgi:hypothetical protein